MEYNFLSKILAYVYLISPVIEVLLDLNLSSYFYGVVLFLLLLILTLEEQSVLKQEQLNFDYRFRTIELPFHESIFKNYRFMFVFVFLPMSGFMWFNSPYYVFIGALVFHEIVYKLVYRINKPFKLYIVDNDIIFMGYKNFRRDLTHVTAINFSSSGRNLYLVFSDKEEVIIKMRAYKGEDIQKLLEIVLEKSVHNLQLPYNYVVYRKNVLNKRHVYDTI